MIERVEIVRGLVRHRALLAHPTRFLAELDARAMTGVRIERVIPDSGYDIAEGGIAVVPILGAILSRADEWDEYFGISDYQDIIDRVTSALSDPAVRGVLLEVDSPGGEAAGAFDCHDALLAAKVESGKPMWAIAKECACSGSYLIATVGDRVVTTQSAELGSIGVIAVHEDQSAFDARLGVKYTFITAGAKKANGNSHQPLSDAALADEQGKVDAVYDQFVTRVAARRNMSVDAVKAQEAGTYLGAAAVQAGLADEVATLDATITAFAASLDASPMDATRVPPGARIEVPETPVTLTKEGAAMADPKETPATPAPVEATAPQPDPTPAPKKEGLVTEPAPAEAAAQIVEIGILAASLGIKVDAADAIRRGLNPDAVRKAVFDKLAKKGDTDPLVTSATENTTFVAAESPLITVAKAAAEAARAKTKAR